MSKEHYGYHLHDRASSSNRIDLNDLLKRAKDQEKNDKRLNILILSGVLSVVVVVVVILSL